MFERVFKERVVLTDRVIDRGYVAVFVGKVVRIGEGSTPPAREAVGGVVYRAEDSGHNFVGWSPYDGLAMPFSIEATYLRGDCVFGSSVMAKPGTGRFVAPAPMRDRAAEAIRREAGR